GAQESFLAKYNAYGFYQWALKIGNSGSDFGYDVAVDASGNVYATGAFAGPSNFNPYGAPLVVSATGTARDVYLAKYSSAGYCQWVVPAGGSGASEDGLGVAVDGSGNAYITGTFEGTANFNPAGTANLVSEGTRDAFVAKYNSSGSYQWATRIGGISDDFGYGIAVDGTGKVVTVGYYNGQATVGTNAVLNNAGKNGFIVSLSGTAVTPLTLATSFVNPSCPGSANGTATATASGAAPPYTYWWSIGQTTSTAVNLAAGSYTVMVTAGNGQTATASVTLANPSCNVVTGVVVSNVANTTSTVNFNGNACAVKYRLQLRNYYSGALTTLFVNAPSTSYTFTTLTANSPYEVKVQTYCTATGSSASTWSAPVYFTTTGPTPPVCVPPSNVSVTALSNTSLKVTWTPVAGSVGYQVIHRKAGTTTWTTASISYGYVSSRTLTGLTPNTAYEIRIRTRCTQSPSTYSTYSTTTYSTPLRTDGDEESLSTAEVQLYPNPASSNVTISYPADLQRPSVNIYDVTGRMVLQQNLHPGNASVVSIKELAAGSYYVVLLENENKLGTEKLIIVR
ncbi:MAG TPA: fibronectin type III domain-containing protein, partial [Chitinophagales bacterium]|nr:fibronectin type III domain-containing protein [Chitinophagales bacterium]